MSFSQDKMNAAPTERPMSRIESDIDQVKTMADHVDTITSRIVRHARSLGYFEPPSDAKTNPPTPVVTTLADALQTLMRAIDHASGSLNVFD
jgi:hypothetical protein